MMVKWDEGCETDMRDGICVAGNIIVDFYKEVDGYPERSTLSSIRQITKETGGLTCNCALALNRIDPSLPITVLGRIGNDDLGDYVLQQLSSKQVIDTNFIVRSGETSFTDVMVDRRDLTRTFFHYRGANEQFSVGDIPFDKLNSRMLHIGYILLLDTLDQLASDYGTEMARVLAEAKSHGIKTSIDVVSEDSDRFSLLVPPALRHTDYAIINEYEAAKTTNMEIRDSNGRLSTRFAKQICERLFECGVSTWVVIHAREGAMGMDKDGKFVVLPSLAIEEFGIVNTTGAGDAFLSGTLYGAYCDYTLEKSMKLGISAAANSLLGANAYSGIGSEETLWSFFDRTPKDDWFDDVKGEACQRRP